MNARTFNDVTFNQALARARAAEAAEIASALAGNQPAASVDLFKMLDNLGAERTRQALALSFS